MFEKKFKTPITGTSSRDFIIVSFAEVFGQCSKCASNNHAEFQNVVIFVKYFKEREVDSLFSLSKIADFDIEIRVKIVLRRYLPSRHLHVQS